MNRIISIISIILLCSQMCSAQERKPQNRPYVDLRTLHYGFFFGMQMQDIELENAGPQTITNADGTTSTETITCDQDNWNPGFTVGVLSELRLNTYLSIRFLPTMHFGTKHITFHNLTELTESGKPKEVTQNLKTIYVSAPFDVKYSAERYNNHRPYVLAGINPMMNLTGADQDYLKLQNYDCFVEVGLGCDFYLPFFKLIPELKFCYGLSDCIDQSHADNIIDQKKRYYAKSVSSGHSKMIVLTFYFE